MLRASKSNAFRRCFDNSQRKIDENERRSSCPYSVSVCTKKIAISTPRHDHHSRESFFFEARLQDARSRQAWNESIRHPTVLAPYRSGTLPFWHAQHLNSRKPLSAVARLRQEKMSHPPAPPCVVFHCVESFIGVGVLLTERSKKKTSSMQKPSSTPKPSGSVWLLHRKIQITRVFSVAIAVYAFCRNLLNADTNTFPSRCKFACEHSQTDSLKRLPPNVSGFPELPYVVGSDTPAMSRTTSSVRFAKWN